MIPDLRARLKEAAKRTTEPPPKSACLTLEKRIPFLDSDALRAVSALDVRRLGLDVQHVDPQRILFLDTETTGLAGAGTAAFLIGMGWLETDSIVIRQLFMRDYPEESAQLEAFAERLHWAECLVTFNGKSFDVPVLRDRFTMLRMRDRWQEKPHLDLLHAARRTWKPRIGRCSLGTLEREILGFEREDDLPGSEAPERFFRFLKTGDFSSVEPVIRHNAEDVLSLARLLVRLAAVYEAGEVQQSMLDVLAVGRALERFGEPERARRCYRVASLSALSEQACRRLALSYAHTKEYEQAAEAYSTMIARGEGGAEAYKALAILLEWRLCRPKEALEITQRALAKFSGGDFRYRVDEATLEDFRKRYLRLSRKLSKNC